MTRRSMAWVGFTAGFIIALMAVAWLLKPTRLDSKPVPQADQAPGAVASPPSAK